MPRGKGTLTVREWVESQRPSSYLVVLAAAAAPPPAATVGAGAAPFLA